MSFSSVSSKILDENNSMTSNAENRTDECVKSDEIHEESMSNKDEPLDPRIQIELERANAATSEINNLETQFDEAQQIFQSTFATCKQQLAQLSKRLGSCVERARPFYDACKQAEEAQLETQKAAQEFQRSVELYRVAKETLSLAESKLLTADKREFDAAWQEYVNHATMKVMQAEHDKTRSERTHEEKSKLYQESEQQRVQLYGKLKRAIIKSRPYFDAKANADYELQNQKFQIEAVQKAVFQAKKMYRTALTNLERISEEIHTKRKNPLPIKLPPREPGVGSEKPDEFIELPDLELTEFPKIDVSDESADEDKHEDALTNSIGSLSMDGLSLNHTDGTSLSRKPMPSTSDYESFADCMRRSPIASAAAVAVKPPHSPCLSTQSTTRISGEGSSSTTESQHQQRRRKNGMSTTVTLRKNGKPIGVVSPTRMTMNNETPLLSHLFGTHKFNSDSNLNSMSQQ